MNTLRAAVLPFLLAAVLFLFGISIAHAQFDEAGMIATDCASLVPGSHAATAEDVTKMRAAGITDAKIGQCWNPNDPNVGATDAQAKIYLRSVLCKTSQFGGAGADGTIQGLDSKFAVCAAKFMQAMSQQLPGQVALYNGGTNPVCLREGYRTPAQQQIYYNEYLRGGGIACGKNGVQNCEHPRGIAIDINTATEANYQQMWNLGPQYGVNFYLRARDKVHFVPLTGGCTAGGNAVQPGGVSPYGPGQTLPTNYFDFPQYYVAPGASAPMSPLGSFLNSLFGGMQQPLQQLPLPTQSPYQQPFQQQTYPSSDSQYQQVPQYASDNGSDLYPSTQNTYTTNTGKNSTGTSSQTQGQQGQSDSLGDLYSSTTIQTGQGDNSEEIINQYANLLADHPVGSTATSSPASLNIDLHTVGSLQGQQQNSGTGMNAQGQFENPYGVTQTFQPLYGDTNSSQYSAQQLSSLGGLLERLRAGLISFLRYLQPFQGRNPNQLIVD